MSNAKKRRAQVPAVATSPTPSPPHPPRPACSQQPAAGGSPPASSSPPPRFTFLLDLMMLAGVLDAADLTAIACCSHETRAAVESVWDGICTKNPATRLCSVERPVDDAALNNTCFREYVPVSQAGACVVCGKRTRFRHPVEGSMLCAPCGQKADMAPCNSPLFRFGMWDEDDVKERYGISSAVDQGKHLRYAERRAWAFDPLNTIDVSFARYAPAFVTGKLEEIPGRGDMSERFPYPDHPERVFLERDVWCLMLEKFGGSRLWQERLRNYALPGVDPAKPDE